jgi:hypothetical protein
MGFPFLSPLKPWIVKKLREREGNLQNNFLKPFVMVSSAAIVTKSGDSMGIIGKIKEQQYDGIYHGCVIANTTEVDRLYQTGNTIVGYDLTGKEIIVEGELNRRVSTPLITKVDIDTDGGNNTLKSAKIEIKVFTLKQLEMFELFFLRPGMNVVLEYGNTADVKTKYLIQKELFASKDYIDYVNKFVEIYSHKDNAYKDAKLRYLKTLETTGGNYDYWAGKVTNFTLGVSDDGTYNIMLEISAGNELQMWMPIKQSKPNSKVNTQDTNVVTLKPYQTWVNKLAADLGVPNLVDEFSDSKWEKEFFNWGVINAKAEDTKISKKLYISFRLILHIINKIRLVTDSPKQIGFVYFKEKPNGKIDGTDDINAIIPIHSNQFIISSNEELIIPGKLPKPIVTTEKEKDVIRLSEKETIDGKINGYSFNVNEDGTNLTLYGIDGLPKLVEGYCGNLLNVFFNYESFVKTYIKAYTAADVINSLLQTVSANMYGLCNLTLQKESDTPSAQPLTIIDRKLTFPKPEEKPADIYRFNIGVGGLNSVSSSIIQGFTFNMELSTLQQAQALYQSQIIINQSLKDGTKSDNQTTPSNDPYRHADMSFAKNADGYYSIDSIEVRKIKDMDAYNKVIKKLTNSEEDTSVQKDKAKETEKPPKLDEVIKKNFVNFKENPDNKTGVARTLIYKDPSIIQHSIKKDKQGSTALTYIEISIVLDGIAGISCGEYFHMGGVPEIYNQNGYFQIMNVKHMIDDNQWKTELHAGYLIKIPA